MKGTDPYLLSVFQAEATRIQSNIKAELPDQTPSDQSTIINIFLQPRVPVLLRAVNHYVPRSGTAFTKDDGHIASIHVPGRSYFLVVTLHICHAGIVTTHKRD